MKDVDWFAMAFAVAIMLGVGSCVWENAKIAEYCASKGMARKEHSCVAIPVKP